MAELLIVDDEIPVRLALRTLGDWASAGVETVHEASNGRDALAILEAHPEIAVLITDIKMPVMDGIALISHARRLRDNLLILALSAFEDYDLIREAFKRGASDYVLKPRMEPAAVVAQVAEALVQKPRSPLVPVPVDPARAWLRRVAEAVDLGIEAPTLPDDSGLVVHRLSVLDLWVDDFDRIRSRYLDHSLGDFQASLEAVLGRFVKDRPGAVLTPVSPQEYLLALPWATATWTIEAKNRTQELKHLLGHYLDVRVSMGISAPVDQAKAIPAALREARSLVQLRHLLGRDRILFPSDARDLVLGGPGIPELDPVLFRDQASSGDFRGARQAWTSLVAALLTYRLPTLAPYRLAAGNLIKELLDLLSRAGLDAAAVWENDRHPSKELERLEDLGDLGSWLGRLGTLCLDALEHHRQQVTSHHVLRARRFLEARYPDPELSLDETAAHVGLSKTYFSTLFEKEAGTGYSEFLAGLRVHEAQRLLKTSNLKLGDIAERCGFNSVEYFCRAFRKHCGTTPGGYRKA